MNKGFTLVELIAVIVILALLMIITTPAYDSISGNINTRNYESKKSTIKAQTQAYVEKYMKNDVYDGPSNKGKRICFTVDYLIQNGIISSDNDKEEYIENTITGERYKVGESPPIVYIQVFYDYDKLKLQAFTLDEIEDEDSTNKGTNIVYAFTTDCDVTY